ncbi:MAG: transporter substrate-binding domain-containing protein [Bacteroidales bacterium]|nr:transporter substrate-binding domain-containing protein [Bacteroidales bacterium]
MRKRLILIGLSLFVIAVSCSSDSKKSHRREVIIDRDLDDIRERGKMIAITDFNSTSYFIYRGEPMGFQFELLQAYADYLNLDLEIITENDLNVAVERMNRGDADLLAFNLTISNERREQVNFTMPIGQTRQVLVQRKPSNWLSMTMDQIDNILVRNQLDLAGKSVYVQSGSSYYHRLLNLQDEIGDSINIIPVPLETEELVTLVARGEIDYTVCDENVALVNRTYYSILDVDTPVSFPQNYAWGVRRTGSDHLLESLNEWIRGFTAGSNYALLYAKYFRNPRSRRIFASDLYSISSGRVSPWDDFFKQYSDSLGWDWRLLASMSYQESRFDPDVVSWAGAYGLMQLMPSTGSHFGIDARHTPEENIKGAVLYLQWLQDLFEEKVKDTNERLKFILAAYNAGPGHVLDARKLAVKNGRDPELWSDVGYYLLRKSEPEFYHDPVVEHGFCRGEEPYNYVVEVLNRYEHYQNFIPAR